VDARIAGLTQINQLIADLADIGNVLGVAVGVVPGAIESGHEQSFVRMAGVQ
jgi:hypothetical protein